jgi:hypothetical protein
VTQSRARTMTVIVAAVIPVIALLLVGFVLFIRRDGTPHLTTGPRPPPLSTTSMEDWTSSVCQPGSFQDGVIGNGLPNASGSGHCTGNKNADLVTMGTYARMRLLNSDVAQYRGAIYATIRLTSGEIFAFVAPLPGDRSVLDPLTRYGFTVHGK